jgi:hypothetical protein
MYTWHHLPLFDTDMEGFKVASIQQYMSLINFDKEFSGIIKADCPLAVNKGLYWARDDRYETTAFSMDFSVGQILLTTKENIRYVLVCKVPA